MALRGISRFLFVTLLVWATLPLAAQTTSQGQNSTDNNYAQPTTASSGSPAAPAGDAGAGGGAAAVTAAGLSRCGGGSGSGVAAATRSTGADAAWTADGVACAKEVQGWLGS